MVEDTNISNDYICMYMCVCVYIYMTFIKLVENSVLLVAFLPWLPSVFCFFAAVFKFNSFAEINLYLTCVVTIKCDNWLLLYVPLMRRKKFSLLSLPHSWLHSHRINEHLKTSQCQFGLIWSSLHIIVITTRNISAGEKWRLKNDEFPEIVLQFQPLRETNIGDTLVTWKEHRGNPRTGIWTPLLSTCSVCECDGVLNLSEPKTAICKTDFVPNCIRLFEAMSSPIFNTFQNTNILLNVEIRLSSFQILVGCNGHRR